ncbi:MAG TPA: nucleotide disphospho-sugar-binding domain-containing protein [Burkholderiaceae bacterium]|nr:nucleotide disphospho-sugar-binding domain-containing protein [Burkholderiaceae bacterium]
MARFLWLNWSGGGNLPPSLGIARALSERGHMVSFAGRPEMVPRVQAAGFRAIEIQSAYEQVERYPAGSPLTRAACYLTSPAVAAEVRHRVADENPDLVLIDGMFPAALSEADDFRCRSAVICHTFLFRQLDRWGDMLSRLNGMREKAGFERLPSFEALWQSRERIIVTTLAAFDAAAPAGWEAVLHVGPSLEDEKLAQPMQVPSDGGERSTVLVSFSTGFEQRSVAKLQNTLDALAPLPARVVTTTGGIVKPEELSAPANATVIEYAAHDPILRAAALTITHGGHGTAMRSLRHGVPMILMPGLAHDQELVARTVEEWGAGLALPGDAPASAIREAASRILGDPSFRSAARSRAAQLNGVDGAANAADEIEAMLHR